MLLTTFSPLTTESTFLFPLCPHFLTFLFHCRQSRFVDGVDPCLIRLSSEIVPSVRKLIDSSPTHPFALSVEVLSGRGFGSSGMRRDAVSLSEVRTEFTGCHNRF